MCGVYKVTNTINGRFYIGQSKDIRLRIAGHRSRNAYHCGIFKEDIEKYGIDSFVFEVVEECPEDKLLERERYYIKTLKPPYNVRMVIPTPPETREKISGSVKKLWANMTQEERAHILKYLTGPRIGHPVSEETRAKLRAANLGKKIPRPVRIVETGEVYLNAVECAKALGVSHSAVCYNLRGKTKLTKGYHIEFVEV